MRARAAAQVFKERGISSLVHCGDYEAPFVLFPFRDEKFTDCFGVFGNNDGEKLMLRAVFKSIGRIEKAPAFTEIAGRRFAVLHEPMPDDVMAKLPVDVVLFGHTHEVALRPGGPDVGPLVLNPGECCGYLSNKATIAVLDTDSLGVEIIELK
jgi:hypothetical protein